MTPEESSSTYWTKSCREIECLTDSYLKWRGLSNLSNQHNHTLTTMTLSTSIY